MAGTFHAPGLNRDVGEPALADDLLIAQIADGDREAFAELYRRHHADICRFAAHMCGSNAAAEDIVHENLRCRHRQRAALSPRPDDGEAVAARHCPQSRPPRACGPADPVSPRRSAGRSRRAGD